MNNNIFIISNRTAKNYTQNLIKEFIKLPEFKKHYAEKSFDNALKIVEFADGEMEANILQTIRNKVVYIFVGSGRNSEDIDINKNKIELLHIIDAVKRSGAKKIVVFMLYFSSSRSDRMISRNSVGFWIDYKILSSLGVNHVITFQLHSDKLKTAVDPVCCYIDDIPAFPLLQKFICDEYIKNISYLKEYVKKNWAFCSVDAGGENVARNYAVVFETDLVIAHKKRDYSKPNTISEIKILSSSDLSEKEIWIVDDMIDTGGSICALLEEFEKREIKNISIAIAHPIFNGKAVEKLNDFYQRQIIKRIISLDTIEITQEIKEQMPYLRVVNTYAFSANIIATLYKKESLSKLFTFFSAEKYLASKLENKKGAL